MPIIRPSSDLRNSYNEISTICHETNKPIYITKNGAGDLAVMSIELYESLTEKYEEYNKSENNMKTSVQIKKEETKTIETNHTSQSPETSKQDDKTVIKENGNMKIDNNYTNKDNKQIKNNHINREIIDNKAENNHKNSQKPNSTETVFRKIDTDTKPIKRVEPESAHEILQEIEIEPIMQPEPKEETRSVQVKDINNTDWIFEDLNKMLNDIKV